MSVFKPDVPEIAYRFHICRPDVASDTGHDLLVAWYRGADNVLWCVRRGVSIVCQCNTHSAVEPLVRAWFLGDCIPGIVADFVEERGEGEPWLLRLLRDDPDWHASVPNVETNQWPMTTTLPMEVDYDRLRELAEQYRDSTREPSIPWPTVQLPAVDWTYRPWGRHLFITNPQDRIVGGPVVVSGPTE